uniref:Uncharacterized protein n=1 Tax=Manihot esculenta TaxID=3983 RepID=A0A2C9V8Q0_MANES
MTWVLGVNIAGNTEVLNNEGILLAFNLSKFLETEMVFLLRII